MKIVVATDWASSDVRAAREAAARPWPPKSVFCVLSVFNPYPFTDAPMFQERLEKDVLEQLKEAVEIIKQAGWPASTQVCIGSARREINNFARDWAADLVMVGCNELSDAARLLLGSTAQAVIRHAPCSVEVVRPSHRKSKDASHQGMKILVATDGSEFSLAALRSIASRPWPNGSVAKVISVPEFILFKNPKYVESYETKDFGKASLEDARSCVAAGVEILSGSGLKVCSEVSNLVDRPYQVILDEANSWGADMISVGSHGRTGFDRVIMGSVSEAVALHAKCSVEVIRHPIP